MGRETEALPGYRARGAPACVRKSRQGVGPVCFSADLSARDASTWAIPAAPPEHSPATIVATARILDAFIEFFSCAILNAVPWPRAKSLKNRDGSAGLRNISARFSNRNVRGQLKHKPDASKHLPRSGGAADYTERGRVG